MAVSTFGTMGQFDACLEPWLQYTERLVQYFYANDVEDDDKKRAIFLTLVGPATYGLLKNLLAPALPTERTFEQLTALLNRHFDPVPSEIVERYKFNSRVQKPGETVANFLAELRRLAKDCAYGPSLDMMLRDRIVCGILDPSVQRKLLSEPPGLTLTRASEIALAMETAVRNSVDLKASASSSHTEVNLLRNRGKPPRDARQQTSAMPSKGCFRCGDLKHRSDSCRFIKTICHSCGKVGHLAKICQSKKTTNPGSSTVNQPSRVHQLRQPSASVAANEVLQPHDSSENELRLYDLFSIMVIGEAPSPFKVSCMIEGKKVLMEVDSGAPFSLIPRSTYVLLKEVLPPLQQTSIRLQSYTKHAIEVLGAVRVNVSCQGKEVFLPLLVVGQGSANLIGRNWISPLSLMPSIPRNFYPSSDFPPKINFMPVVPDTNSLDTILGKHKALFTPGLGKLLHTKAHLTLIPSAVPKYFKARPVPYALLAKVDSEIDRSVQENIFEPVKTSEWAAPVVPVLKRDGSIRLCGDFKLTVNASTELEQYPLPRIEDLFAQLSGGESFTKLDLKDAYCQLELDDESRKLVVLNTHRGLFRYTRLPFGVASAPAIFQREIDKILQGQSGASCYLDDLLVTGADNAKHLENLDSVLSKLKEAGLKLNPSKCEFMKSSVEYLGHQIDKHGLHPTESKLSAIDKAPAPTNVEELRSFIGLLTYYSKFLPQMATLLAPLYKLLERAQPWTWLAEQKNAFEGAKTALRTSALLVHFDNNREVILACDASPYGLGAVLSHTTAKGEQPVAFASRTLSPAEKNYSHIEKEALALVFGVTRFRNYLLGREFILQTDHHPLVSLLSEKQPVPTVAAARIQRWALTLSAYKYRIQFRKGILHANADACSRLPVPAIPFELPQPAELVLLLDQMDDSPVTAFRVQMEIEADPVLTQVRNHILQGWPKVVSPEMRPFWLCRQELSVERNIILKGTRVFIPMKFREFIVDELHDGHQGMSAIKSMARFTVWWPNIDSDLESRVRNCTSCRENASMPPSQHVPWPASKKPWDRIHVDHAGPVDNHMLLIIVDSYSKWLEVVPVPTTSSAASIAVLRSLFSRFGLPRSLVSDNGTSFSSDEFRSFMTKNGISHIRTAPYHPKSNGLAERAVRTVKTALSKITGGNFKLRLERFLYNYRRTPTSVTGFSPAFAMSGREMRSRLDLLRPDSGHPSASEPVVSSRRPLSFNTGDAVWVRNYSNGPRWVSGSVIGSRGNVMLEVETPSGKWIRHYDQVCRGEVSPVRSVPEPEISKPLETSQPFLVGESLSSAEAMPIVDSEVSEQQSSKSPVIQDSIRKSSRVRRQPKRLDL